MVPEGLGSIAMWKDFPEQLAQATGFGVLVYSRYGHGKSERLAEKRSVDFMHHEAKVVLPELLRQFEIQQPILLGHSDGASIAIIDAGAWPHQVRALILEAPHVFVEDVSVQSIANMRTLFESTDLPQKLARYHDHVEEVFRGWNNIWLGPRFSPMEHRRILSPNHLPRPGNPRPKRRVRNSSASPSSPAPNRRNANANPPPLRPLPPPRPHRRDPRDRLQIHIAML